MSDSRLNLKYKYNQMPEALHQAFFKIYGAHVCFWHKAVVVQARVRYERGAEVKMAHSDRDVLTKDASQPGTAI